MLNNIKFSLKTNWISFVNKLEHKDEHTFISALDCINILVKQEFCESFHTYLFNYLLDGTVMIANPYLH